MLVVCLPEAISEPVFYTSAQLAMYGCNDSVVDSYACTVAIWALCVEDGWEYGHGPVEWNSSVMQGVCIGDR